MLTCGSLSTPAASAPVLVQSLFRSGHSNNIEDTFNGWQTQGWYFGLSADLMLPTAT